MINDLDLQSVADAFTDSRALESSNGGSGRMKADGKYVSWINFQQSSDQRHSELFAPTGHVIARVGISAPVIAVKLIR